ncbi:MAG: hybrid sensor histidine kinase/response regulator [Gemmatimonadetes bacterium]|nr:hybrid sensor histidine kinase/response regulator [Gemmatimonadota bacterium]
MRQKEKILVVDDNALNRSIAEEILEGEYEVTCVESGEEALEKFPVLQPSIVLLDIMMPGINGYETCEALRNLEGGRRVKIVLVSAKNRIGDRLKGYETGADDYVVKPFDPEELRAKIDVFVRLKNVEELDRFKQDVLQLINHETRTPITAIMQSLTILDAESKDAEARRWVKIALSNTNRLVNLLEKSDLLSRFRSGDVRMEREKLNLAEEVAHALDALEDAIKGSEIEIDCRVPEDVHVQADQRYLRFVLNAVIDNAIRFSEKGSRVCLQQSANNDSHCRLVVTDFGEGIDSRFMHLVFEPFTQRDIHHHSQGLGISLALCREIMQGQAGAIRIDSDPGRQTDVHIELPLATAAQDDSEESGSSTILLTP